MAKYYVVKKGLTPGIYDNWAECEANVKGFSGAEYMSFTSEKDAKAYFAESAVVDNMSIDDMRQKYLQAVESLSFLHDAGVISDDDYESYDVFVRGKLSQLSDIEEQSEVDKDYVDVYVDGSYNAETNEYGFGVYIDASDYSHILCGKGPCEFGGRNIEGEISAARNAISYLWVTAKETRPVVIHHDYEGVGKWADGKWQRNSQGDYKTDYVKGYVHDIETVRGKGLNVVFNHVKGHSNVAGNELVDRLAKFGCGIELSNSDKKLLAKYASVDGYPVTRGDVLDIPSMGSGYESSIEEFSV